MQLSCVSFIPRGMFIHTSLKEQLDPILTDVKTLMFKLLYFLWDFLFAGFFH